MIDYQILIVAILIAGASLYVGYRTWRTWAGSKKGGCGGGCGCSAGEKAKASNSGDKARIPLDQVK
jgi:hypothetical protein